MPPKSPRKRLDLLLVERGLAESRQKAQAMILAGEVTIDAKRAEKAGQPVAENAHIEVHSRLQKYASRGGFTDCLLQQGAARVYAVDVNIDQLAWKLREDPRVIVLRKNARELAPGDIPEPADLAVIDVSFISVTKILPGAVACCKPGGELLILIKPQFELERADVGKGGIVRDAKLHEKAIASVRRAAEALGLTGLQVFPSRLPGGEGNQEYFLHAVKPPTVESL